MYALPGGVFRANIHDQTISRGREDIVVPSILATNQLGYSQCERQIVTAGTVSTQGRTDRQTDVQATPHALGMCCECLTSLCRGI